MVLSVAVVVTILDGAEAVRLTKRAVVKITASADEDMSLVEGEFAMIKLDMS